MDLITEPVKERLHDLLQEILHGGIKRNGEIEITCLWDEMNLIAKLIRLLVPYSGGGYLVERWVRGCAAQIGCFFGLSGLPMAPFLFENWFRYRSRFCKMHKFQ